MQHHNGKRGDPDTFVYLVGQLRQSRGGLLVFPGRLHEQTGDQLRADRNGQTKVKKACRQAPTIVAHIPKLPAAND